MSCIISEKILYGIKNPKVRIYLKNDCEIKDVEVLINGKKYHNYNKKEVSIKENELRINLVLPVYTRKVKITMITEDFEKIIIDRRYDYIIRGLKVITKPFRIIWDYIYRFMFPIIRAIKLMWVRHHFLIPPKKLKRYIKSFMQSMKKNPVTISDFYDLNIKKDYNKWILENKVLFRKKELKYNPLISIIIPTYNVSEKILDECINSVLIQSYQNFEICIADDNSTSLNTKNALKKYKSNEKIKIKYRDKNGMISQCMNSALELATGEFVAFLDNDDLLDENALYYMVEELNKNNKLDLIYSDEDKLDTDGNYCDPYFKPDWSPDTFLSMNYICHFTMIRKKIIDQVGYFNSKYDGAQDYDLFLRVTEKTNNIGHIPKILYHWRKSETSTAANNKNKDYAKNAGKLALEDALKRRNIKAEVLLDQRSPFYIIDYKFDKEPKISIVIPTKDHKEILEKCIDSIINKTTYKNYEIIVVDNNTTEMDAIEYLKLIEKNNKKVKVLHDNSEFNYSKINNDAIATLDTDYILLLNNDTEVITENWLNTMVGYASQKHVGCVGAKLIYPDETIQHGGVVLGLGGVASHVYIGADRNDLGYFGRLCVPYDYSANTAACLMISKKKYDEVGGLEEKLKVAYNDIDFNIKILKKGYYNVFLPQVELYHYESKSRGYDTTPEKKARFKQEEAFMYDKWKKEIENDKFYNKNFSLRGWFLLDRGIK